MMPENWVGSCSDEEALGPNVCMPFLDLKWFVRNGAENLDATLIQFPRLRVSQRLVEG